MKVASSGCLVAVLLMLPGCGEGPADDLRSAESFTLYSVLSMEGLPGAAGATGERFHGHVVLGKIEITDASTRKSIADAFQRAVPREADGRPVSVPACFQPRHGIRVRQFGMSKDYLICFECRQIRVFMPMTFWHTTTLVDFNPQRLLNGKLRHAGIALDPTMPGD